MVVTSLKTSAAAVLIALSAVSFVAMQSAYAASSVDTNGDGSINQQEARDAASKKFDKMDTEHTGKLTEKQVSPMSEAIREMAAHDKDHTIDKGEYMAGVDAAFKEADPKGTGVLSSEALKTPAGKHFLELVE